MAEPASAARRWLGRIVGLGVLMTAGATPKEMTCGLSVVELCMMRLPMTTATPPFGNSSS